MSRSSTSDDHRAHSSSSSPSLDLILEEKYGESTSIDSIKIDVISVPAPTILSEHYDLSAAELGLNLPPPRSRKIHRHASRLLRIVSSQQLRVLRSPSTQPDFVIVNPVEPPQLTALQSKNMGQGSWTYSDLAPSFFSSSPDPAAASSSTSANVHVLPPPPTSSLTHHVLDKNGNPTGKYSNPWPSWQSFSFSDAYNSYLKGATLRQPPRADEEEDTREHGRLVRVVKPDWEGVEDGHKLEETGRRERIEGKRRERGRERICWLGHAGVLMQIPRSGNTPGENDGSTEEDYIGVVFDPIFSKRCSPSQWIGPSRKLDPPCALHELPPVHVCCISHDHYDHLDYDTIMGLWRMNREEIHFFVPLGVKKWFLSCQIPSEQVTELDWHQEALIHFPPTPSVSSPTSASPSARRPLSRSDSVEELDTPDLPIRDRGSKTRGMSQGSDTSYASRSSSSDSSDWQSDGSDGRRPLAREGSQDRLIQPSTDSLGYPPFARQLSPTSTAWSSTGLTLKIVCAPAQHRSGRGLTDQMSTLWCSWVVGVLGDLEDHKERKAVSHKDNASNRTKWRWRKGFTDGDGFRGYFAGDTGFRYAGAPEADAMTTICPAFRDIAHRYGPVDVSFLPISTGSSLSFLRKLLGISLHHYSLTSSQHCNAWDAIQISRMMGSKATLAIHHSTFSPEDESRGCIYEFDHTREDEEVSGQWGEDGCFVVSNIGEVLEMSVKPKKVGSHLD